MQPVFLSSHDTFPARADTFTAVGQRSARPGRISPAAAGRFRNAAAGTIWSNILKILICFYVISKIQFVLGFIYSMCYCKSIKILEWLGAMSHVLYPSMYGDTGSTSLPGHIFRAS